VPVNRWVSPRTTGHGQPALNTNKRHSKSRFTDGTLDWLWSVAERHHGWKLIVDHMGVPRASKGEGPIASGRNCWLCPNTRMWRSQWIGKLYRTIRKSAGDSLFQHFTEFYPV
jgi:hypothetical protein